MTPPRSYLFVPADRPERFAKALASGADAVIIDLEDAVAPAAVQAAFTPTKAELDWARRVLDVIDRAGYRIADGGVDAPSDRDMR